VKATKPSAQLTTPNGRPVFFAVTDGGSEQFVFFAVTDGCEKGFSHQRFSHQ